MHSMESERGFYRLYYTKVKDQDTVKLFKPSARKRQLIHNENLRFRGLYKPPEIFVVVGVVLIATIISLVLNNVWPLYFN